MAGVELTAIEAALYERTPEDRKAAFIVAVEKRRARLAAERAVHSAVVPKQLEVGENGEVRIKETARPIVISDNIRAYLKAAENDPEKYEKILRTMARSHRTTVEDVREALIADIASGA